MVGVVGQACAPDRSGTECLAGTPPGREILLEGTSYQTAVAVAGLGTEPSIFCSFARKSAATPISWRAVRLSSLLPSSFVAASSIFLFSIRCPRRFRYHRNFPPITKQTPSGGADCTLSLPEQREGNGRSSTLVRSRRRRRRSRYTADQPGLLREESSSNGQRTASIEADQTQQQQQQRTDVLGAITSQHAHCWTLASTSSSSSCNDSTRPV